MIYVINNALLLIPYSPEMALVPMGRECAAVVDELSDVRMRTCGGSVLVGLCA